MLSQQDQDIMDNRSTPTNYEDNTGTLKKTFQPKNVNKYKAKLAETKKPKNYQEEHKFRGDSCKFSFKL